MIALVSYIVEFIIIATIFKSTIPFLSAHKFVDNCVEDMLQHQYHKDSVVAEIRHRGREPTLIHMADIPVIEKLEKFIEDVR